MFLVEGQTTTGISEYLKTQNIISPAGKGPNWTKNTVESILTNEKYKGDALLQKSFTENYLEQKMVKNTGQIPQYYVENSHPAIIDKGMWELVQIEYERRRGMRTSYSSTDIFSTKLVCSDCGSFYGRKKWYAGSKYERYVYRCNHRYNEGKARCKTPHLYEKEIKEQF